MIPGVLVRDLRLCRRPQNPTKKDKRVCRQQMRRHLKPVTTNLRIAHNFECGIPRILCEISLEFQKRVFSPGLQLATHLFDKVTRFRLFRSVLIFCWLAASLPAALHRPTLHPETSLNIFAMCEYNGYLWLAAADGLYRYDGLQYHKVEEYPFPSARFLSSTGDGSLWIGASTGLIRYAGGRFRIVNRTPVLGMTTAHHQLFISEGDDRRLARVDSKGRIEKLKPYPWGELTTDNLDRVWFVSRGSTHVCSLEARYADQVRCLDLADHYSQAAADRAGRVWVASDSETHPIEGADVDIKLKRKAQSFDRPGPLVTGSAGRLWFLGEQISELASGLGLTDRSQSAVFPPTAGYEDSRGKLWVATKGRGLVEWELDPSWERWSREDLGGQPAAQLLRSGGDVIAVTHGSLFRLDPAHRQWVELPQSARSYDARALLCELRVAYLFPRTRYCSIGSQRSSRRAAARADCKHQRFPPDRARRDRADLDCQQIVASSAARICGIIANDYRASPPGGSGKSSSRRY